MAGGWNHTLRQNPVPGDVVSCLLEMGIQVYKVDNWEAKAACPAHSDRTGKENSRGDWSVNTDDGMHNCLAGETEVITWEGTKPIRDLAGQEVRLLTSAGWATVPVRSFGVQQLRDVVIRRNGVTKIVRATPGHRWFTRVSTGRREYFKETTTAELRPGHRLRSSTPYRGVITPSPWGVAHGVTFGDGTRRPGNGPSQVVLWGAKDRQLEKYFPDAERSTATTPNGVEGVIVGGLPRFFKEPPSLEEHPAYLYGWLAGYFAADGCVSSTGQPMLSSASKETLEFVRDVATRIGLVTHGVVHQNRLGYGDEPTPLYRITFSRRSLTEDFFLIEEHRARWSKNRDVKERLGWVVVDVIDQGESEEVFCAQVPGTHDFTLADNLLTGNCFSCGFSGQFITIVEEALQVSREEAVEWTRARGGIERVRKVLGEGSDIEQLLADAVDESDLALFIDVPEEVCRERDIDPGAADDYRVLWDDEREMWITCIREYDTDLLIGWQEKNARHFRNHPEHMEKSDHVYGINDVPDSCGVGVLVESPLDCAYILSAGVEGGISTMGAGISERQLDILVYRFDTLVSALDNDPSGDRTNSELRKRVGGRANLRFWNYGRTDSKDPGEQTYRQVRESYDTAYSAILARW